MRSLLPEALYETVEVDRRKLSFSLHCLSFALPFIFSSMQEKNVLCQEGLPDCHKDAKAAKVCGNLLVEERNLIFGI
jgi:hypothetical protein